MPNPIAQLVIESFDGSEVLRIEKIPLSQIVYLDIQWHETARMLPEGGKVTLNITFDTDESYALVWTVESFFKLGRTKLVAPKFTKDHIEFQFAQRCFLSPSGAVIWHLLWANGTLYLSVFDSKNFDNSTNVPPDSVSPRNQPPRFVIKAPDDSSKVLTTTQLLCSRDTRDVGPFHKAIEITVQFSEGALRYMAGPMRAMSNDTAVSNGLMLYADWADDDQQLWQSCSYLMQGGIRTIHAGIDNVSSKTALRSWTEHIVVPYLFASQKNQDITILPKLHLHGEDAKSPQEGDTIDDPGWAVGITLTDGYVLGERGWKWSDDTKDSSPNSGVIVRVDTIKLTDGASLPQVVASMPAFRREDSTPLTFTGLLLTCTTADDASAWSLKLTGQADESGGTQADVSGGLTQAPTQSLRIGGLGLKTFPCVAVPKLTDQGPTTSQVNQFTFAVAAHFISGGTPTASGLKLPIVTCSVQNLPLYDVQPAAEDDLDKDLYEHRYVTNPDENKQITGIDKDQRAKLDEIFRNMRREHSIVFGNPALKPQPTRDGVWGLSYQEHSSQDARPSVNMQLLFGASDGSRSNTSPTQTDAGTPTPDESVLVFSREPFSFADVHYRPLNVPEDQKQPVLEWSNSTQEWTVTQLNHSPSSVVFPPQIVAEENVTSKQKFPQGLGADPKLPKMALGMPAIATYAPVVNEADQLATKVKLPWDLHRLMTDHMLNVSRIDYEFLYGMPAFTDADGMRLTEAATLYGDLMDEFPQQPVGSRYYNQSLAARLYWSRIHRECRSRLGIYIVHGAKTVDEHGKIVRPDLFSDAQNTSAYLRLDKRNEKTIDGVDGKPIESYGRQPSLVAANPDTAEFHGGALDGIDQPDIYRRVVSVGVTGKGNAAVLNPRFSALGGFGEIRGRFAETTPINEISMGRTVTYTVEQIGRIACHWNRAKHVVVYERTVAPSRQFYQEQDAFYGITLVRKVDEYVELIDTERIYANEPSVPHAAFARGFKCTEKNQFRVNSSWGSVVPGLGWKVPLWNPSAAQQLPDVYPRPKFYLEVASPEKGVDGKSVSHDALLTNPEEVFFYTSYSEPVPLNNAEPMTDDWKPVAGVDRVDVPLLAPDSDFYDNGDMNATPPSEIAVPPGWEPVTFHIAPPAMGVHVTSGVVESDTPMAAQLTHVTVSRGPEPVAVTVPLLLKKNQKDLKTYTQVATQTALIAQAFDGMATAIRFELASSNVAQTAQSLQERADKIQQGFQSLRQQVPNAADGLKGKIEDSFQYLGAQIKSHIQGATPAWVNNAQQLAHDAAQAGANADHEKALLLDHMRHVFQDTKTEVDAWGAAEQDHLEQSLNRIVRRWSDEIESVLANYVRLAKTPVGQLSPLRQISGGLDSFRTEVDQLNEEVITQIDLGGLTKLPDLHNKSAPLVELAQHYNQRFDAAVSQITQRLTNLQHLAPKMDPSLLLLVLKTAGLASQFQALVDGLVRAATAKVNATSINVDQEETRLVTEITGVIHSVRDAIKANLETVQSVLDQAQHLLDERVFDLLQYLDPTVKSLYAGIRPGIPVDAATLAECRRKIAKICAAPDQLLDALQQKAQIVLTEVADAGERQLVLLAAKVAAWLVDQANGLLGPFDSLVNRLNALDLRQNFAALQGQLDSMAREAQGLVDQASQVVNQYVRGPVMDAYKAVVTNGPGSQVMRVVRAFGAPPQAPHLDIQPPQVAYLYREADRHVGITPVLARANQAGQVLNALGIQLPAKRIAERLIPAELSRFNMSDILSHFAGLHLPGLFSGVKLPAVATDNIRLTHGWEPQARRTWLDATADVPFPQRMTAFDFGFLSLVLSNSTFRASSHLESVGLAVQQHTSGSIDGLWGFTMGGSEALIDFGQASLTFDEQGKFQFKFNPQNITLTGALKSITELMPRFADPDSGFTYGSTPTGIKCAFALPVPDTAGVTSGITGLRFYVALALDFTPDFTVSLDLAVSTKDRPFNFAIFILGGCGYLQAGIAYNILHPARTKKYLDLGVGCSASLAIAFGPISGGVYAQFGIELHAGNTGFSVGAFFQIVGHVSICGIISVDLVFRLEANYGGGVMEARGHFSIKIKLFMFSFSVSRDVSMQLGQSGQSGRLNRPFAPPGNEIAALAGPGGFVPGMAAAFAAADAQTPAQRYISLLL